MRYYSPLSSTFDVNPFRSFIDCSSMCPAFVLLFIILSKSGSSDPLYCAQYGDVSFELVSSNPNWFLGCGEGYIRIGSP